jgi:hypothetical protein
MNRTPRIRVIDIASHRNGICGAPFHVALFEEPTADEERLGVPVSTKVAVVFDAAHHCAVLDIDKLDRFDIAFGSNSWRGDNYEAILRNHINQFKKGTL